MADPNPAVARSIAGKVADARAAAAAAGSATWRPVDSRRTTTTPEQDLVAEVAAADRALAELVPRLPATLHMIRDNMAGQPQAANTGEGDRPPPLVWCTDHEQTTDRCLEEHGTVCAGEVYSGPNDPTGNAAVVADRAARHHRDLVRRLRLVCRSIDEVLAIASGYPTDVVEPLDAEPEAGEMWCRCCWKVNKSCVPITLRANGQPYYRGLCKWCGQRRQDLGGDPPAWMVARHLAGERVNSGHMAKARAELAAQAERRKTEAKNKKTKRRRK